jgi:hypothetical protein
MVAPAQAPPWSRTVSFMLVHMANRARMVVDFADTLERDTVVPQSQCTTDSPYRCVWRRNICFCCANHICDSCCDVSEEEQDTNVDIRPVTIWREESLLREYRVNCLRRVIAVCSVAEDLRQSDIWDRSSSSRRKKGAG